MSFFEIAALAAAAFNFSLAVFVYRQNATAHLHRAYLVWGLGVALWNASAFWLYRPIDPEIALLFAKLLQLGIIVAPIGLFITSMEIAQRKIRAVVFWSICALHALFIASLFTNWFVTGVRRLPYGYWGEPGPIFWVYMFSYVALTGSSIFVLYHAQRDARSLEKIRIRALLGAIVCIWVAGSNDLLPILKIDEYPLLRYPIYPLGSIAACIYMTVVAYSVLQHTLLDVHVTLSRVVAHAIRIAFVMLSGLCLLLVVEVFAPKRQTTFSFLVALIVLGISSLLASVFFPRLFGTGGAEAIERRLLGDSFEYQDKVRNFIEHMPWYSDLDLLLADLHETLVRAFRFERYHIVLRDETTRAFTLFRAFPEEPQRQLPELKSHSAALRFFEWDKGEYLALGRSNLRRLKPGAIEREAREQLGQFQAEFCFPLASQSDHFGLLLIGRKLNGDPFTATDITLLVTLVKSLGLMVNQIQLKTQITQSQELDLLGKMSRGMAHDLNNLLTPVWTLLQLSAESGEAFDDELLPVAQRNIKTMRAYIKEALFFSENLRPDLQFGRLDIVVQQAADLARASRKKDIDLAAETPGEVLVEMDEVLVQRLFANLISNAIDASRPGTRVRVVLERLIKTEAGRDWLRVRVIDEGEGIPKENLSRILTPYFTTKNRGDENRGFGLGLAICRKIVNLHGGNLSIVSQPKKGTTVQVDFPSRQIKQNLPPVSNAA